MSTHTEESLLNEEKKGFTEKIKAFDIYRKVPTDITEPTFAGALISSIAAFILILLFVMELKNYMQVEV